MSISHIMSTEQHIKDRVTEEFCHSMCNSPSTILHTEQERMLHDETVIKRSTINTDYEKYTSGPEVLGSGVNGQVTKLVNKSTGKTVAMKQIPVSQKAAREVTLHLIASKDCEYITEIENVYLNRNHGRDFFYVMMECCEGGELFDYITKRDNDRESSSQPIFTEREVAWIIRQIAKALYHLHVDLGIAHRDLKPENILLTADFKPLESGKIMLTDFGFAKEAMSVGKTKALSTACYTPYYVAPEVFSHEKYDFACDVWSLGVILYILLCGYPPFYSGTGQNTLTPGMKSRIQKAKYATNTEFKRISDSAKDLIDNMLKPNSKDRITISDIMQHPWLVQNINEIPDTKLVYGLGLINKNEMNKDMTELLTTDHRMHDRAEVAVKPNIGSGNKLRERRNRKAKMLQDVQANRPVTPDGPSDGKMRKIGKVF
jgi:mitogen-activated protein kinase-activated protein kinase 3